MVQSIALKGKTNNKSDLLLLTTNRFLGDAMEAKIFEATMLICFGSAWPFSIYRTWKAKSAAGKSILFLSVIFVGYIAGILFKMFGNMNGITFIYILNAVLVSIDILLTLKYKEA